MPDVVASGVRLRWETRGSGEPLLLVMGHMYGRQMWDWVVPALSEHFQLVLFDNRGIGESDAPSGPYRMADLAADAVAVLDAAGVESAHVFGMSMGGLVAQELALTYPERVRSLVLGCTAAFKADRKPASRLLELRHHLPVAPLHKASRGALHGSVCPPANSARNHQMFRQQRTTAQGLRGQSAAVNGYASWDRIPEISHPTLVLHGEQDRAVPLARGQELVARIPGARLVVLPGAGHMFIADLPERAAAEVRDFLLSLPSPDRSTTT